ncbi:MAG: hypothetical protein ACJ8DC_02155 [Gemmatimonadales bacterium]
MTDGPGVVIIAVVLVIGLLKIFRGPVGEALADRLRGRTAAPHDTELMAEVEAMRTRLAEVEERLDFAERLLARRESTEQLPGGVQ